MSLPKPSSLSAGPPTSKTASPGQVYLPSPLPASTSETPSPPPDSAPTRASFSPFFTLLVDPQTGEHHHPTTHYVFSDDSSDMITAAAMRTLEDRHGKLGKDLATSSSDAETTTSTEETGSEDESSGSVLPPRRVGVEERYVVLDIAETGDAVVGAQSMSEGWQVMGVEVSNAPTWDKEEEGGAGLMLKVEGMGVGEERSAPKTEEDLSELVGQWEKRMLELRKIMGSVDRRGDDEGGEPLAS
ncbi:MAG: hypothetical protein M1814_000258 [Vezdaea aestivalis]|nr:MAG: hypothetical protein M1814_000258 [Vezdaea aestivalis]